jgi:hypothetical protein
LNLFLIDFRFPSAPETGSKGVVNSGHVSRAAKGAGRRKSSDDKSTKQNGL